MNDITVLIKRNGIVETLAIPFQEGDTVELVKNKVRTTFGVVNGTLSSHEVEIRAVPMVNTGSVYHFLGFQVAAYAPAQPVAHTVHVEEIPVGLVEDANVSNSASNMFSTEVLKNWFRNLLNPTELEFNHSPPNDDDPDASRDFYDYIKTIENAGFKVWDVQNRQDANTCLVLESNGRRVTISGRPDFQKCLGQLFVEDSLHR